jgi:hypothetical protein
MNKPDDLELLWQTLPVATDVKGEEMRQIIMQKMSKFDRTIRRRNMGEVAGALVGAIGFSYIALGQTYWASRLGSAMIMATLVWIIYYFLRHGSGPADPNPDQNATGYQRALIAKIDHQIRLVRNAKFWFLLPMYVGLLLLTAGDVTAHAAAGKLTWRDAVGPVFYTLVFAVIWWANDVYAAGKLQHWRTRLESGVQVGDLEC